RLQRIPPIERQAEPRGGELQARRDNSDLPRDHQPRARALDHQGRVSGALPRQRPRRRVEARERRVPDGPAERRFGHRGLVGRECLYLEFHRTLYRKREICLRSRADGEGLDGLMHQDVDGLRLQQPDNVERCSAASATTTPFWSTLAMSGRSDFHVTVTGAAGEPSSLSARGNTRVFSDGSRYTVGGSIRSTAAGPEPTT